MAARYRDMAAAASNREMENRLSRLLSDAREIIPTIKSFLQHLNPQNPNTHQNPSLSILNQFSPYLTQDVVVAVIKNQTSPFHSLFFFNWASNPIPNPNNYRHSHICYIAITDKLLSHKLFSLSANLLKSHNKFSDFMVGKFIKAHGDLGHLKWSVKLFDQVKRNEFEGCLSSFNVLLGVLVKAHKVRIAWGYFGNIVVKSSVLIPNVSTYTTMIRGLCIAGMIEDAQKLFDEMTCAKNIMTYNIIIHGLCKNGLVERAQRIVDGMVGDETCSPDVIAYTTLIDGYCKKGEVGNALKCFGDMVNKGNCEPNVLTYNALINGLCLNEQVDEAKRMMSRMRLAGLRDNIATHTSILKGYSIAGRSEEAIKHFKEMTSHGMFIDGKAYSVIADEYCKLGRPDEAVWILKEMRARSITPSVQIFNCVLRCLIKLHEFDKAIRFLKHMAEWGCRPNFLSYSEVLIGLILAGGSMQDVDSVVNDMIRDGHALDTTLYSLLIQAYCINGNVEMAIGVFEEMIGGSLVIKRDSFEVFVKELSSRGLICEVENLFHRMRNSCSTFDVVTYQNVLNKYARGDQGDNSASSF